MGLLTPWFLAGLAVVAVPILLHLVQREEPVGRLFPSLMFFRRIPVKTRRKKTLRDPFLLMLRCLALAMLALSFAGPYLLSNETVIPTATNEVDRVIVVDKSYSMAYPGHWTSAIDTVQEQIGSLVEGERAAILVFDKTTRLIEGLTADRARLRTAIERLRPGYDGTNYAAALAGAERVLRDSSAKRQEVVLISDMQRVGLNSLRTPRLNAETDLKLIPIGPATGSNAAVMDVDLMPSQGSTRDARRTLTARIRNTGFKVAPRVQLVSKVDDQQDQSHTLDLEPGAEHTFEIPLLATPNRVTRVQIQLSPDGIAADDVFYIVLAGEQPTTVLLVEPDSQDTHAAFFITQALALAPALKFEIVETTVSDFDPGFLADADVVILDDVRLPDEVGRQALSEFVADGGGLLVVAADGPRGQWSGGDQGFLPGRLGPVVDADGGVGRWAAASEVHPLLDALRKVSVDVFSDTEVYRYRNLFATNDDLVLARFDDGAPALVERIRPSGRVLVMTTTLDPRWSSLAFTSSFAPFLIETIRYLAYRSRSGAYLWAGNTVDLFERVGLSVYPELLTDFNDPKGIVVESPAGKTTRLSGNKPFYSPELPGFHELHQVSLEHSSLPMAVNVNRVESNLAIVSPEEFYAAVLRPNNIGSEVNQETTLNRSRSNGNSIAWWFILMLAALLLLTEALFANRLFFRTSTLYKRQRP